VTWETSAGGPAPKKTVTITFVNGVLFTAATFKGTYASGSQNFVGSLKEHGEHQKTYGPGELASGANPLAVAPC